jgi:hypothetical protein
MRECMAIQVVATWPALKMHLYSKEDRPWVRIFPPLLNYYYPLKWF